MTRNYLLMKSAVTSLLIRHNLTLTSKLRCSTKAIKRSKIWSSWKFIQPTAKKKKVLLRALWQCSKERLWSPQSTSGSSKLMKKICWLTSELNWNYLQKYWMNTKSASNDFLLQTLTESQVPSPVIINQLIITQQLWIFIKSTLVNKSKDQLHQLQCLTRITIERLLRLLTPTSHQPIEAVAKILWEIVQ